VAAQRAYYHGAEHILVLDFDAHCGGGTYSMTRHLGVVQIDVSTSPFDWWRPEADDQQSDLETIGPDDYLPKVHGALARAQRLGAWDIVIYNAGMDPFNTGVSAAVLKRRERMVAEWCSQQGVPTVVTVAGGYTWGGVTMEQLVRLHRSTFEQFAAAA
jgi:acetoin utilization deacetylase AcuC-like enzyme